MIIEIYGERITWDAKKRQWKGEFFADQLNDQYFPFTADPNPEVNALQEAKTWYPSLKVIEKAKLFPIEYEKDVVY